MNKGYNERFHGIAQIWTNYNKVTTCFFCVVKMNKNKSVPSLIIDLRIRIKSIFGGWGFWQKVFVFTAVILGGIFILLYLNRWWAGQSPYVPVSIYDNAILLGVIKLENGIQLYHSSLDSPSDYFTGPFPTILVYAIRLLVPNVSAPSVTHKFVMISALVYSLIIASVSLLIRSENLTFKHKYLRFALIFFLVLVAMPKERFIFYYSEQICWVFVSMSILLMLMRLSSGRGSYIVDSILGVVAACAFLTKANYLSVFAAVWLIYIMFVNNNFRSLILFNLFFFTVVGWIVLTFCDFSGWFNYTILFPSSAHYNWQVLLTGLYSGYFMTMIILIVIGLFSIRYLTAPVQRYAVITLAIIVSFGILTNMLYPGGTANGAHNIIFIWIPLLIPGLHLLFEKFGHGLMLAIVCLGVQSAEPSATSLRMIIENHSFLAERISSKYPDAEYLTFSNWNASIRGFPPKYDFNCFTNLEMVGFHRAGLEILRKLEIGVPNVVVDEYFFDSMNPYYRKLHSSVVTTLDSINIILAKKYELAETITAPNQFETALFIQEQYFFSSSLYVRVYKPASLQR